MTMNMETRQGKILIVDDEASVQSLLRRIVGRVGRECSLASSAEEARRIMEEESFDLVLCDIRLPGESGIGLVTHIVADYPETAVIMVSGVEDPKVAEKALEIGAYGYIIKPFKPSEIIINISSALRRQRLETESRHYRENLERMVESRTTKLRETLDGIIQVVVHIVESRDPYTAGHQRRVAELACAIAQEMGCPEEQIKGIRMAGIIHDIGKISIPSEILSKPGRLSDMEFELIRAHPQVGYEILKGIDFPWPVAEIAYQHHERMDGAGYPRGLKDREILLEARIISVADVVEAMSSHRPYRPALGMDVALEEIFKNRDKSYDPDAVDACLEVLKKGDFDFAGN
ncbi:MAG: response regulator [Deltaproteobacteria bacterium]|nr:response regulator [Deltaproteobacteria bacterium]